ncbi:cystinosin [Usnea florida]
MPTLYQLGTGELHSKFSPSTIQFLKAFSRLLGWIYTLSWSASFYPQPLLNIRRRSTHGTTPAFPTLNVLGFLCYTISTLLFYYSPLIQSQYRTRNNGEDNTVRANDVAFAVHAQVLCILTLSQFWHTLWGFEKRKVKLGKSVWGVLICCTSGIIWVVSMVMRKGLDGGKDAGSWAWLDVVYAVGYVKLVVTVVKYIPQAWANYQRKSTAGWSIYQILLDVIGGVLSIAQLVIDSSLQSDWSGITGNPVKLGLGNVSIFFDIIFIVQHYILYKGNKVEEDGMDWERRALVTTDEEETAVRD